MNAPLRAPPPETALAWLVDALDAEEVLMVEPMLSGSTSALHRVTLRTSGDSTVTLVMRRYVLPEILTTTPGMPRDEAAALAVLEGAAVPAPRLLAADLDGAVTDVPTIVMTLLDGRIVWNPRHRRSWLAQIVDTVEAIHATPIPDHLTVSPIARYDQSSYEPPRWATPPDVWERAVEIFQGPIPDDDICFVHRDFHPGNLLWRRGQLTGVVDWQAAGIGPASIDISHCRLYLLYEDPPLADDLRTTWEQRTGHRFDPWADVMSIVGVLDNLRTRPPGERARRAIESALAGAVDELTP